MSVEVNNLSEAHLHLYVSFHSRKFGISGSDVSVLSMSFQPAIFLLRAKPDSIQMATEQETPYLANLCAVCTYLSEGDEEDCAVNVDDPYSLLPFRAQSYTVKRWLASAQEGCAICAGLLDEVKSQEVYGLNLPLPEDPEIFASVQKGWWGHAGESEERLLKFNLTLGDVRVYASPREESMDMLFRKELH